MESLADNGTQRELTECPQLRQGANSCVGWTHQNSVHQLLALLRDFMALQDDDTSTLRNQRCTFKFRDSDIRLDVMASESASAIRGIVVSVVVCNIETWRKKVYTLMTKVMRMNTALSNMKLCRVGGDIVLFQSVETSLLCLESGVACRASLCEFLAQAARIMAELSSRSTSYRILS